MRALRTTTVAALAWLSIFGPVLAAIGTPPANLLGSPSLPNGYTTSGGTTNVITTTVDAPPGSLIVVPTGIAGTTAISSVKDSAGNCANAYTPNASVQAGSIRLAAYYCNVTGADLPSGGTITSTFVGATGKMVEMAFTITGIATSNPVDVSGSSNSSSANTQVTGVTITPTSANSEILIACVWITSAATGDNYLEDAGWNSMPTAGSTTNVLLHCAWKTVAATTPVTWAPTWTNNRSWTAIFTSFKAAGAGAPSVCTISLLGAGPC
jgi:hypothetical protein